MSETSFVPTDACQPTAIKKNITRYYIGQPGNIHSTLTNFFFFYQVVLDKIIQLDLLVLSRLKRVCSMESASLCIKNTSTTHSMVVYFQVY
jgi:hypothetical protein